MHKLLCLSASQHSSAALVPHYRLSLQHNSLPVFLASLLTISEVLLIFELKACSNNSIFTGRINFKNLPRGQNQTCTQRRSIVTPAPGSASFHTERTDALPLADLLIFICLGPLQIKFKLSTSSLPAAGKQEQS